MDCVLRNFALYVLLIVVPTIHAFAQENVTVPEHSHRAAARSATTRQQISEKLDQLQQAIATQQQQVQARDEAIQRLQQQSEQAQAAAAQAQQKADAALAQDSQQGQSGESVRNDLADLKTHAADTVVTLQATQSRVGDLEHPLALHYKGVTLTPVGFLAAETVWRQHGLGADINTPFNSIPFNRASQSSLSEFFGSGRQSRVGLLAEGKLDYAKVTGYMEGDFLSSDATSNNSQSNSYTLRQRQMWGQAALDNGWSFTRGQMWSLVTETKNGADNRSEAVPMTIDPAYHVGFSWARQYGFRVVKDFGDKMWLALSV